MTASAKPMTPTMTLPLHDHISDKQAVHFVKDTSRLTLSQIVDKVTVTERLSGKNPEANNSRMRTYTVLLDFYPTQEYCDEYHITPTQVQAALAYSLGPTLQKEIKEELKKNTATLQNDLSSIGKGLKTRGTGLEEENAGPQRRGRDDEIDDDDEDSGQLKRKAQARQHEYEAEDAESNDGLGADLEDILERQIEEDAPEEGEDVDADAAMAKAKAGALAEELADIFGLACKFATSFSFDHEGGRSCQFDLNVRLRYTLVPELTIC
jgi:DNA-directed RNA polymerase I subunit RPA1